MQIAPVTQSSVTAQLVLPAETESKGTKAPPKAGASGTSTAAVTRVTPQQVSNAAIQRAVGDGDGRTGTAALNDGDAAAAAAAQQAKSAPQSIDFRA
jgi:hypothetical protein